MFTRRTATVMISAPEASSALRVCSNEAYLPVPMMSREPYSVPAMVSLSVFMGAPCSGKRGACDPRALPF